MEKQQQRILLSMIVRGCLELLFYFPILLVAGRFGLEGEGGIWLWLLGIPVGYPIGYMINKRLAFRHSFPVMLVAVLLAVGAGYLLYGLTPTGGFTAATLAFGLYRGGRLPGILVPLRLQARVYVSGVAFYFLVSLIFLRMEQFSGDSPILLVGGALTLVLTLFTTNRHMVGEETLSQKGEPTVEASVKRYNGLLVAIILVFTVLLGFTYQIQQLLQALGSTIARLLSRLFSGSNSTEPPSEPPAMEAEPPMLPEQGDPSPIWNILTTIFMIVLALGVLWLLYRLLKYVPGWIKQLQERIAQLFGRERHDYTGGYVDEVVSLQEPSRLTQWLRSRGGLKRLKWSTLQSNEERVRYLYKSWLGQGVQKGYGYKPHLTPTETATEMETVMSQDEALTRSLIGQYNEVRYGKSTIADEEVEKLRGTLQSKKK